jgi:hypothetical protein
MEHATSGVSQGLFPYGDELLLHTIIDNNVGFQAIIPDQGSASDQPPSLSPDSVLGTISEEQSYTTPDKPDQQIYVQPAMRYSHSLIGGNNSVAVRDGEVFAVGRFARFLLNFQDKTFLDPFTMDYITRNAVLQGMEIYKYDGRSWQVLYQDQYRLALAGSAPPLDPNYLMAPQDQSNLWSSINPNYLAAAKYPPDDLDPVRIFKLISVNQESE